MLATKRYLLGIRKLHCDLGSKFAGAIEFC